MTHFRIFALAFILLAAAGATSVGPKNPTDRRAIGICGITLGMPRHIAIERAKQRGYTTFEQTSRKVQLAKKGGLPDYTPRLFVNLDRRGRSVSDILADLPEVRVDGKMLSPQGSAGKQMRAICAMLGPPDTVEKRGPNLTLLSFHRYRLRLWLIGGYGIIQAELGLARAPER